MKNKPIDLFKFPTNLGLRKKAHENEPGVKFLPEWLISHGLLDKLNINSTFLLPPPAYTLNYDRITGLLNEEHVAAYAKSQASLLEENFGNDTFKLLIGGDCSILIGTAIALKKKGTFALFFLDGHTDYITPRLSETGGIAGMDLAIAAGLGPESLTNIGGVKPYLEEEHVFCVGNREYDPSYVEPMLHSAIGYYDLKAARIKGPEKIVYLFLQMIEEKRLDGFFIHLDADVLNDSLMPAVDSRAADGLSYEELTQLLRPLIQHPKCAGMEITILDPTLDKSGEYTKPFLEFLSGVIN